MKQIAIVVDGGLIQNIISNFDPSEAIISRVGVIRVPDDAWEEFNSIVVK